MNTSIIKKVLIIQTAFLGDVILATPVIEHIHKKDPDIQIDLLIQKGNEALFHNHPFLNQIILFDKKKNKISNLLHLIQEVRSNKYHQVINLHRFFSSGLITVLSGALITVGFDKNPLSIFFTKKVKHEINSSANQLHEVQRNLSLIQEKENIISSVKLHPSTADFDATKKYKTSTYICIAPASIWFTKQFPVEKWVEFINKLPQISVYLLGSINDQSICKQIIIQSKNKQIIDLSGQLNILETCTLMKDAHMNFCNDSAPLHLASAMNAPVTAVFCSTIPAFGFGPLSDNSCIIEVKENLSCRPCGLHGHMSCPEKHFKCAMNIDSEQLLSRIKF